MKGLLFVPHYSESLKPLIKITEMIDTRSATIHFLLLERTPDLERCIELLQSYNMSYSLESDLTNEKKIPKMLFMNLLFNTDKFIPLLKRYEISTIICANDGDMYLAKAAKKLQIKTIGFQWAHTAPRKYFDQFFFRQKNKHPQDTGLFMNVSHFFLRILNKIKERYQNVIYALFGFKRSFFMTDGMMDCYCLMGPYYQHMFHDQGTPLDKLLVTGHPEHDVIFALKNRLSGEYKNSLKMLFSLNREKKVIILGREAIRYFDIIPEDVDKANIRNVLDILSHYKAEYEIVVKAHPRDEIEYYDFIPNEYPFVKIFHHNIDYYSLLSTADLYIAQISSTMYWAIGLGIPTISYDFNNLETFNYMKERTGFIFTYTPEDMKRKVDAILNVNDKKLISRIEEASKLYMMLDGNCVKRIISVIGVPMKKYS